LDFHTGMAAVPFETTVSTLPYCEFEARRDQGTNLSALAPRAIETRDHEIILQWASRHQAAPATGESTESGPATLEVRDGGASVRFNFPGASRFRPIGWSEWFEHFDREDLVFVYEEDVADRAFALWMERGSTHGHDRDDWLEAERQFARWATRPMGRYRLTPRK
jgi:hypothetical protein